MAKKYDVIALGELLIDFTMPVAVYAKKYGAGSRRQVQ